MIDINIKKFCKLISKINTINDELDIEKEDFYDGGYTFEECNGTKINELTELQDEFKHLMKKLLC